MIITDDKLLDLQKNYINYIPYLQDIHNDFGGPSVHFHRRALLEGQKQFLSEIHLELIYATLASWGMHRMGPTKTKMVDFEIFQNSILALKSELEFFKEYRIENISDKHVEIFLKLQDLCFSFKVSISNSRIVGNSKVLAHILPHLIPPIDRQYTIRFFSKTLSNFQGEKEERKFFDHIIQRYYQFSKIIKDDNLIKVDSNFNTSYPKIMDNLIMVYLKNPENGA